MALGCHRRRCGSRFSNLERLVPTETFVCSSALHNLARAPFNSVHPAFHLYALSAYRFVSLTRSSSPFHFDARPLDLIPIDDELLHTFPWLDLCLIPVSYLVPATAALLAAKTSRSVRHDLDTLVSLIGTGNICTPRHVSALATTNTCRAYVSVPIALFPLVRAVEGDTPLTAASLKHVKSSSKRCAPGGCGVCSAMSLKDC